MLRQALRPTQAHRQLDEPQSVEESERLRLAALHLEGDHRAGSHALLGVDLVLGVAFLQVPQVVDPVHLGVPRQEVGHVSCVLHLAGHAELERLQAPHEEPAGPRPGHGAEDGPGHLHLADELSRTEAPAGDEVRVPTHVLREGIEHQVGAQLQGVLVEGTQEGVVHRHQHPTVVGAALLRQAGARLDVHEGVGGVGRGLHVDHAEALLPVAFGQNPLQPLHPLHGGEAHRLDPELGEHLVEEVLGPSVDGLGERHHVAGAEEGEYGGGDGGHPALEDRGGLRSVEEGEPVLDDFQAGVVEAGVDEPHGLAGALLAESVGHLEEGLAGFGGLEHEGGRLEDGRLRRPLGPLGLVPVAHHEALGLQRMVTDVLLLLLVPHGDHSLEARPGGRTPSADHTSVAGRVTDALGRDGWNDRGHGS